MTPTLIRAPKQERPPFVHPGPPQQVIPQGVEQDVIKRGLVAEPPARQRVEPADAAHAARRGDKLRMRNDGGVGSAHWCRTKGKSRSRASQAACQLLSERHHADFHWILAHLQAESPMLPFVVSFGP
jgi:hypothetical protein